MKKLLMVAITSIAMLSSCSKPDVQPNSTVNVGTAPCVGKRTVSVQCVGTTQAGNRCQNKTLSCNSRCHLHGGN